jgi:hypothetical protein
MRSRSRAAIVLASTALGLFAYAASAAAVPPPCNPGTSTTDNKSCVDFEALPSDPGGTFTNGSLFFHTHTNFAHPGDKAQGGFPKTIRLNLDSDFRINPGTIPKCPLSALPVGTTIAQAWATCGPGAGAADNAYLSPPTGVSGRVSTIPVVSEEGCTLVFNGPTMNGDPTILLFARFTFGSQGPANCSSPATNNSGNTSLFWQVPITDTAVAGFGKVLVIPRLDQFGVPVDDFTATLKRGNYFQAKCTISPWKVLGVFVYTGAGQPNDASTATQPCS